MNTTSSDRTGTPQISETPGVSLAVASSEADAAAVDAVIDHHAQLAAALTAHVGIVLDAVRSTTPGEPVRAVERLVEFCEAQLLPHAAAEEGVLYPVASAYPPARLLVEAMIAEHRVLQSLVEELRKNRDPIDGVSASSALLVLFEVHLAKENDLLLPLIATDPSQSLAEILSGMHDLLGKERHEDHGATGEESSAGGCGGTCSCGESDESEPTLDVRQVPHEIRHATVFGALGAVPPGGTLRLVAHHDPLPLLAQIDDRNPGVFTVSYDDRGPKAWRLRLTRSR